MSMPPASPPSPLLPAVVAYLGPPGTYSHQAVLDRFGPDASYRPCPTIADVFAYEPSSAEERARGWHAAVPLENSKNGIVLETLDLLLAAAVGTSGDKGKGRASRWAIDHELRVRVRHCLVVRADFDGGLNELEWVRSHEQALAQCQTFLSASLPSAERIPTASTAAAAESLLEPGNERGAAICARTVINVVVGLKIASEGVEDMAGNTTRFLVLRYGPSDVTSMPQYATATKGWTLHYFAYSPSASEPPSFTPPPALHDLAPSRVAPVLRAVDRRPTGDGGSRYLVCFATEGGEPPIEDNERRPCSRGFEWCWIGSWPEHADEVRSS